MDCRLKRNKNKKICKIDKKDLNWNQAKKRYPKLSPCGDADKDKVINRKDCKPFDKKRHTTLIIDPVTGYRDLYVKQREFDAYKYIKYGKEMGLPPLLTHKELKQKGFSGDEMRAGLKIYNVAKSGANVFIGEGAPSILADN